MTQPTSNDDDAKAAYWKMKAAAENNADRTPERVNSALPNTDLQTLMSNKFFQNFISAVRSGAVAPAPDSPEPKQPSCDDVLARAAKYYRHDNNRWTLLDKPYELKAGETPGDIASIVPKLGEIAMCQKR